ncbi:hypothetical protein Tco_0001914 [Tanacetum coccineum]
MAFKRPTNGRSPKHLVQYDDSKEEVLDLSTEKFELLEEEKANKFRRLRRFLIDEDEERVEEGLESGNDDDSEDEDWEMKAEKEVVEVEEMKLEDLGLVNEDKEEEQVEEGYTEAQLKECLEEYAALNVWQIHPNSFVPMPATAQVVTRLVLNPPKGLYYCLPGTTLTRGIRPLKTEKDMEAFIKVGFENGFKVELYTKCYDYDVMGYTNNDNLHRIDENINKPDDVCEEYDEDPENIDFHVEGEQDVVFEKLTIDDPFLTKLVGKGNFIGSRDDPIPQLSGKYILEENDPDDNLIDAEYKIKKGVRYPSYNPETAWDKFQPILDMKFENPLQLKNALADYGVKHGYQLWFYRSNNKYLLVYCGRDIELGRCAGRRGTNKKKKAAAEGDKVKGKKVANASDKVKGNKVAEDTVTTRNFHQCKYPSIKLDAL